MFCCWHRNIVSPTTAVVGLGALTYYSCKAWKLHLLQLQNLEASPTTVAKLGSFTHYSCKAWKLHLLQLKAWKLIPTTELLYIVTKGIGFNRTARKFATHRKFPSFFFVSPKIMITFAAEFFCTRADGHGPRHSDARRRTAPRHCWYYHTAVAARQLLSKG